MKTLEKILAAVGILGFILKTVHIPGGSLLLVVAGNLLALLYFGGGYFLFKKNNPAKNIGPTTKDSTLRIIGAVLAGMSLSISIIGILFRLMHWPGAAPLLIIGVSCLAVAAAISFIKFSQTKSAFYKEIGIRSAVIGVLGIILFFTASHILR